MIDEYKIISYGTKAKVRLENKICDFEIVQSSDVNPSQGKISPDSPIGSGLMRKRQNTRFGLILPNRKVLDCEIIKIY
ncbi:GreA/GreB family elongation factor [Patescibacteria group bacterium]|nr:GreA/GreB family elongation factor [Patescibacteria group bacterium]